MAEIGAVIDGKYEILKQIGKGGMSKVYLAMDQRLNKQWAVKEIIKCTTNKNNEVVVQSLIAEANLMKKLDHPALPRIVDIIENKHTIYVIMDYIEGETLSTLLKDYKVQSQEVVIEWAKQLCQVLYYLHTRKPPIIYRDMKPGNIMLSPEGNIKLIDFGIAREFKEQQMADTISLGTRGYAAPEQFGGKGQTDARTDIYCLGVTLYHLITGQNPCEPPYELYPIRYWNPNLSGGLEKIITKCTQLNPEDRYQSCAEVLYALEHFEEVDDAYRKKQKNKLKFFSASVGTCAFFLIVGIWGQLMKNHADNSNYEILITRAQNSVSSVQSLETYQEAIDIKPEDLTAYLDLIELCKEDAVFTVEEQELLLKKINNNIGVLRENENYADLAFEMGKLYWYYYNYGVDTGEDDNQITKMKSSIKWFEDVITYSPANYENIEMASIYHDIGVFNRDITLNVQEASDKGQYLPYFENIKKLISTVNEDENEIVSLELYKLAMYSIDNYARKFKADGVLEEDIRTVYETVKTRTQNMITTTDKTTQIKEYIMQRFDSADKSIVNAYTK
ncbi:serine/threonine-protein kinase [Konateibacter massiliensis]|uniref:serine/threonine-protein kinase n=1 Tax=Konateibacter massiliensis TaxID=2002841 RepID=UPI000C15E0CC|nr:serine/threonine-protein kinase [Konateibacter massiliensis]